MKEEKVLFFVFCQVIFKSIAVTRSEAIINRVFVYYYNLLVPYLFNFNCFDDFSRMLNLFIFVPRTISKLLNSVVYWSYQNQDQLIFFYSRVRLL